MRFVHFTKTNAVTRLINIYILIEFLNGYEHFEAIIPKFQSYIVTRYSLITAVLTSIRNLKANSIRKKK